MTFGGSNNRGPSIAELQRFIREKTPLVFMLANGDKVVGHLRWADENAFQIVPDGQQPFTILRSAVLGYHRHGEAAAKAAPKQVAQPAAVAAGETTAAAVAAPPAAAPAPPAPAAEKPPEPKPPAAADDKGA
jgi:hypothetical protein